MKKAVLIIGLLFISLSNFAQDKNTILGKWTFKDAHDKESMEADELKMVMTGEDILAFQALVRRVPVPDNVLEYAVGLVQKTRPGTGSAVAAANQYLAYGAGPRASQYLVLGAKCHALINGKYSPDIEDVRAMALPVLRHRILRNYKAEAEGMTQEALIKQLM